MTKHPACEVVDGLEVRADRVELSHVVCSQEEPDRLDAKHHATQIVLGMELRRARIEARMLGEALQKLRAEMPLPVEFYEAERFYNAQRLEQVLTSTSWRITTPLRFAVTLSNAACRGNWRELIDWVAAWRRAQQPFSQPPPATARDEAPETVAKPATSVVSSLPQSLSRTGRPLIVFVSGLAYLPSETYRISHPVAVLRECFDTLALTEAALYANPEAIDGAALLVLFRTGLDERIFDIVARAQDNKCVVVYDVDDLVFDPVIADPRFIDSIRSADGWGRRHWHAGATRTLELIKKVDACTVSTHYLAERMAALGRTALVLPNGLSAAMLDRFEHARSLGLSAADGKLRIGYASGTRTHQRDFAAAKDAVLRILQSRDDVTFTIIGELDLAEYPEFAAVEGKIERRPLVPLDDLPFELARLDINLAPLELGNPFCEAKSELKYFDAAILEIPTVASPISGYWAAIQHGINGYLADQPEEWFASIQRLIDDQDLRRRIGQQARCDALRQFGPDAVRENVLEIYRGLLDSAGHQ